MDIRLLGRTGLRLSALGLGTVKLGRDRGLKYPVPVTLPTDDQALALLATAHELGITLIDTSPAYGSSEARLGELLPRIAPRDHWVLCTKAGERFTPTPDGSGVSTYDFSPAALTASIERSLTLLRTDHVHIALLHFSGSSPDEEVLARGEALGALRRLQTQGKIIAVGASVGTVAGGLAAAACCDVVMLTLNSDDTSHVPVLHAAQQRGIGVLVKKPMGSGRAGSQTGIAPHHTALIDSLRFVLQQPGVTSGVVGTANPAHLAQCAAIA